MDPKLAALRAEFPELDRGLCFLDWAANGIVPEATRRAIHDYVDELAACPGGEATWIHERHAATRNEARTLIAEGLGANAKDIALVESTTAGLNAAAAALRLQPGSNIVLSAIDYLAVATPWKQRAKRDGLELRWVPPRGAAIEVEDIVERLDERTRVVAISTMAWTTGALLDLPALAREARMRGILLVVDAAQSFGVVPIDVRETPVAFLACGGHKWLCSPLGAGFLYVNPEVAARHQPPFTGFLNGRPPRGSWAAWFSDPAARPDEEVVFPATGRTYETGGTPSYPGAIGLREGLRALGAAGGATTIAAHARALGSELIAGLDALGIGVISPREPERRGGIVVFEPPGGAGGAAAIVERLRERRIVLGRRWCAGLGGIRVSLHGMNRREDVARLLEALKSSR